ncbi:prenyltransferase [Paenibacillus sp. 1001270B_150601_E10]|uniref:prenyltransferase n=1 Tax=Paenibacillus sp. 1001270B_150601_E10 TaxID=2787079 RepID=UPI00189E75FA|nr:prenyltransferase [Paenibacillus sp. 1001270B_150601_E10]
MDKLKLFVKASRFYVIPVMLVPVVLGALAAFVWDGEFHPMLLVITVVGAACAHLFSNMINDIWDYKNGVDVEASEEGLVTTNSGMLSDGVMPMRTFAVWTWVLLFIAVLSGVLLSVLSGWWVMAFVVSGGLIAYFYVAPPLKYGYRGKGYSEIAILLAFGVLPIAGSYYVQTGHFDYRAILLSLPVGILTTLLLFNHHFLHWQADKATGKNTLVVVWGEERALRFSRMLMFLAYGTVVLCVILGILPVYGLLSLITIIPIYQVYGRLKSTNPSQAYMPLMDASLKASMSCGIVMIIALVIQGNL